MRERHLEDGEQQVIRRGNRPEGGWRNRTVISMTTEGEQWLISALPRVHPAGGSGGGTAPPPVILPDPPPAVEDAGVQGYARVWMEDNGLSGGSISVDDIHTPHPSAKVYPVTTYAALRSALLASGRRFIRVLGSADFVGNEETVKITNGHFTVDFSGTTGEVTNIKLFQIACDDSIWTQGAIRTREGSSGAKSADRRNITFNPGSGGVLHGHCLDHMSMAWGPDVVGSILNHCTDITIQYSLIGPGLLTSNNVAENPNGYGWNITVPGNNFANRLTQHAERITFYRNLSAINRQRNMKTEHVEGYDGVNNVVFDWGNQAPVHGNPIGANYIGNIFKKGPETQSSNAAYEADDGTSNPYDQYDDSTYHDGNIGITAAGGSFTPTWTAIDSAALLSSPYDGGPGDAAHGPLTVATADSDLFDDVVANAGRTYEDDVDAFVKDAVINGTSDGYYNGAAFGTPHPFPA